MNRRRTSSIPVSPRAGALLLGERAKNLLSHGSAQRWQRLFCCSWHNCRMCRLARNTTRKLFPRDAISGVGSLIARYQLPSGDATLAGPYLKAARVAPSLARDRTRLFPSGRDSDLGFLSPQHRRVRVTRGTSLKERSRPLGDLVGGQWGERIRGMGARQSFGGYPAFTF